ncbi:two pore domain potassium channel family protein [Mycoplasma sp. Pen4]|nr:two pore domain potassium channel family protein [Mycoplasma sp. Pen4]
MATYKYRHTEIQKPLWKMTLKYIFSFKGIIILLCILSSLNAVTYFLSNNELDNYRKTPIYNFFNGFKTLNALKVVRFFFILTLFTPFKIISGVFEKQKSTLSYIFLLIVVVIFIFALLIWNNELEYLKQQQVSWIKENIAPATILNDPNYSSYTKVADWNKIQNNNIDIIKAFNDFMNNWKPADNDVQAWTQKTNWENEFNSISNGYVQSFMDSIYFATITLTTIGYGDYVPHAPIARALVALMSLLGIAIIAIPSGVIAGSFLTQIQKQVSDKKQSKNKAKNINNNDTISKEEND